MSATAAVAVRRQELLRSATAAEDVQRHLDRLAGGVARAAEAVPGMSGWAGSAARAAGDQLVLDTDRLARLATGFAAAAMAGGRHGGELREAAAVLAGGDPAQLPRADSIAAASSRRCAAVFGELAASAPPRRTGIGEAMHRLSGWLGEVQVGAVEGFLGLAATAVASATTPLSLSDRDGALDPGDVLDTVRHPGALLSSVLDERTWRQNPARAVGHLAPDVAAALFTDGASTVARGRSITRMRSAAARTAADTHRALLDSLRSRAVRSRQRLTDIALREGERASRGPAARPWSGEGGAELDSLHNAQAEAMYWLGVADEGPVTARMDRLAGEVGGKLAGLEKRLKTPESFKRKLTHRIASRGTGWPEALRDVPDDLVRYTLVLTPRRYVGAAHDAAAALSRDGYFLHRVHPAWNLPRHAYRGLNTIWQNVTTGRMFELQFHTPVSHEAAVRTRPYYEQERLLPSDHPQVAQLRTDMQEIYRWVPPPPGVEAITRDAGSLIPVPPPAPVAEPADLAALHAVLAGAATGTLAGVVRAEPVPARAGPR